MDLTRDRPLIPAQSALLLVDLQNFVAHRRGADYAGLDDREWARRYGWFFSQLHVHLVPRLQGLVTACRMAGVEVMHTTIESLTADGRDRGLDYKISGFNVARGSWDAQVIDALAPAEDDIHFPKSSSSVFNSTSIDYVLRNLGIRQLAITGLVTDQCVESAVRDACDLGYLVTLVTDCCMTYDHARHEHSLAALSGYCRQTTAEVLIGELSGGDHG